MMMMVAYLVGSLLVFLSPKVVGGESVCACPAWLAAPSGSPCSAAPVARAGEPHGEEGTEWNSSSAGPGPADDEPVDGRPPYGGCAF